MEEKSLNSFFFDFTPMERSLRFVVRSFGELQTGKYPDCNDPYRIMSSLTPKMREAVLNNPSGYRIDEVCQILALDGNVVVGCTNPFSGRLLLDGEVVGCQNGSTLYSHEDYRKDNIGGELFVQITNLHPTRNCYFAGISQMAKGLYHVLKYTVFEFPRKIYLRKSHSVLQAFLHSEKWWTMPLIWIADALLWIHRQVICIHNSICYRKYTVEQMKVCPKEVEDIVMHDEHRFMELHDKAWFDWSLNYTISEDPRTVRRLFVIKNQGKIEAFFLTKQEFFAKASSRGFKNVYLGSVMEWGITSGSKIKEKDIALISLKYFDANIDGIQYATSDNIVSKYLRRWFFVGIGNANIGVRIRSIKDSAIKDMNNWRVRIAGSDTVLN